MNIESLLESMKPSAISRINAEKGKVLADHAERNVLYSSSCVSQYIYQGAVAINDEVRKIVEVLSNLGFLLRTWNNIEEDMKKFINSEYDKLLPNLVDRGFSIEKHFNKSLEGGFNNLRNESFALLSISIAIKKQSITRKRLLGLIEIGKIILAAIIGGYIAKYLFPA